MKIVQKPVYGEKHSFIERTYVVCAHWNCLYEAIPMFANTYVTEIKEAYFEIYTKHVHAHWFSSFKHLKLPVSIKIHVTI